MNLRCEPLKGVKMKKAKKEKCSDTLIRRRFTQYLRSKPGPTAEQLGVLSARQDSVLLSDLAFDSLIQLERKKTFSLDEVFESREIASLIRSRFDDIWTWLRGRELRPYMYQALFSASPTIKQSRGVLADMREGSAVHGADCLLEAAKVIPDERLAIWEEVSKDKRLAFWIAKQFSRFPETGLLAGRYMFDSPEYAPHENFELVGMLHISELRKEIVKRILRDSSILSISVNAVLGVVARRTRHGWVPKDRTNFDCIIDLLMRMQKYDHRIAVPILELGTTRKNQARLIKQLIDRGSDVLLGNQELLGLMKFIEPDLAEQLRLHVSELRLERRRELRKVDTEVLFSRLQANV